jgi:isopenicillin-N N-acyltransferase-like protein
MEEIAVIDLKGRGRELGRAHGEALKGPIREFAQRAFEVHQANLPPGSDRSALLAVARRNLPWLTEYSPELIGEMEGIAQGAGVGLDDILFLNTFLEFEDLRAPELGARLLAGRPPSGPPSGPAWGCTTVQIHPEASLGGRSTYLAQNYDMEGFYSRYNAILRIARPDGRVEAVYTLAGILGLAGLNSDGVGLVINKIVANDARPGVIYPFLVRRALAQSRLGDAFGAVVLAPRASGMVYQLASADGYGFCVEVSAGRHALLPFTGAVAHTNHYLDPSMLPFETRGWLSHGGSYVRREVAARLLRQNAGRLDLDAVKALLSDHTNYPRCVCAHGLPEEPPTTSFCSIASIILDLGERAMLAAHENPCRNPYVRVDAARREAR